MKYDDLIEQNRLEELANINFIHELLEYKYNDKYLIEYLLEKNIHSKRMDEYIVYHSDLAFYYYKYNIIEPLMFCSLKVLLTYYNNDILLDLLLDKLDDHNKIVLYNNIRRISFSEYSKLEREIIDIYFHHGIVLNPIYISTRTKDIDYKVSLKEQKLLDDFLFLFKDSDYEIIQFIVQDFKRNLGINHDRTVNDIKKIIDYKKNNPNFKFKTSRQGKGSFSKDQDELKTNNNSLIFSHELSHLLFQEYEKDDKTISEYENIRIKIDTIDNYKSIREYINNFHKIYKKAHKKYELLYYKLIEDKYGKIENYIEKLYIDIKNNMPDMIELYSSEKDTTFFSFLTELNIKDVVKNIIDNEKEEFIAEKRNQEFKEFLMFENLLDALLNGKIFDDLNNECLSGHGSFYFLNDKNNSFDECLADYEGLRKVNSIFIYAIKDLIGEEIVVFLENYIKKNRGSYGR